MQNERSEAPKSEWHHSSICITRVKIKEQNRAIKRAWNTGHVKVNKRLGEGEITNRQERESEKVRNYALQMKTVVMMYISDRSVLGSNKGESVQERKEINRSKEHT